MQYESMVRSYVICKAYLFEKLSPRHKVFVSLLTVLVFAMQDVK